MKMMWLVPLILLGCDAPVNAPVTISPNVQPGAITVESGLVSPGAVNVDPNAVKVEILKALESVDPQLAAVIHDSQQKAEGQAYANPGGDSNQNVVTITLDGSGWPLVGIGTICITAMVGWVYYRHKAKLTGGWLADVAAQVKSLPADPRRFLLDNIRGRVKQEPQFKKWLKTKGLKAGKPKGKVA